MQLARRECLHVHELRDSMRTVLSVFTVLDKRYEDLRGKADIEIIVYVTEFMI